jgi:hypothetical protein
LEVHGEGGVREPVGACVVGLWKEQKLARNQFVANFCLEGRLLGGVWGSFVITQDLRWEMSLRLDFGMVWGYDP